MRLSKIEYGLYLSLAARSRSEDDVTQVGSITMDKDWRITATGCNGFPAGFKPSEELLANRDLKSKMINHAEANNLLNSARDPYYLFSVFSPCFNCAKMIVASKIKYVYFLSQYIKPQTGKADLEYRSLADMHGVNFIEANREQKSNILNRLKNCELDFMERLI